MSSIYNRPSNTGEEYVGYGPAVVLQPEPSAPVLRPTAAVKHHRRPEFYKPFHLIMMVYLFLYCSRVPEMIPSLHVGLLLQPLLLIGMFMTKTMWSIFNSDIGKLMTAFTVWVAACVPLSVWKGGSFTQWELTAQALVLLFFMAAFIRSVEDCFRAMYMVALAMGVIGILSVVVGGGRSNDYRLGLGTGGDTLADANFLALYLVVGLPFLWFCTTYKRGVVRLVVFLLMIPVLAGFSRTGSRMGLLALGAGVLLFFIFGTALERMVIILGGVLFLSLALTLLPDRVVDRFTTYFNADSAVGEEAASSAEMRKVLFIRSVQLSLEHPLFGVGPGQFMVAEAGEAAEAGRQALWHYTHNSYTELSSETGIPGLALFLFALYRAYKGLSPIRNRYRFSRVGRAALYLQIAVLMSCIGAFFLSIAYSGLLYAILGISAAFQVAVAREAKMAAQEAKAAAVVEAEPQPALA